MADITPERINIQQEETKFRAAVTESTLSRVGAGINFINNYQANLREFMINGPYHITTFPHLGAEALIRFPFPWEIVDLYICTGNVTSGSGTTELDVKWKPFNSGAYGTIFSTTPKFTSSAATFETVGIGQTKTGFTAPVLSKTTFAAYDQLRLDIISAVSQGEGTGIGIVFRPI